MSDVKNLLLLLEHPQEPVFVPKGSKGTVFDVPSEYLSDKYRPLGQAVTSRFGASTGEVIRVKKISTPPIDDILELKRDENFSLFLPKHRQLAGRLTEIFMRMHTVDDLISMACYARDRVNPYLFNYSFSVALLHREDTKHADLPSFARLFPDKYVDSKFFTKAREEAKLVPVGSRVPLKIPMDFTATEKEEEHRLAYFREDLGANLHHWHWHLVYPLSGGKQIVAKNRRGELFYYMHQQLIARYNFERFCNKLNRVERLKDFDEPIKEAYFPKLDSVVASRSYPARVANMKLQTVDRVVDQIRQDVNDLKMWSNNIINAIHKRTVNNVSISTIQVTHY
jgi:tyrosinase